MGLIAEYGITCECLPLVAVKADVSEATLDVELQPNHGNRLPFIVHVTPRTASIERAFESASFVAEYTLVGRTGETRRYQILPAVGMEAQLGEQVEDLSGLRALATTDSIIDRIRVTSTGWIQTVAVFNPITYGVDGVRAFMLGQDVMTVFTVTAFSSLWNTVVPAVAVLVGFNVILGGIAIRLLNRVQD